MTPDIVAALHAPRLPDYFTAPTGSDFLAAFGIGLILAVVIVTLAAPALHRRPRAVSLADRLKAAADLPPQERALTLVRLIVQRGGTVPQDQRAALYSRAGGDPASLEALLRRGGGRR